VDKVTSGTVGTEPNRVIGPAQFGLVFRMSGHTSQIALSVRKLAFFAIFASSMFRERSAQLRLVSASVDL